MSSCAHPRPRVFAALALLLPSLSLSIIGQTATPAQCVECHSKVTPNIVSDWKLSKHSGAEIGCVTCHGDQHTSASDVAKESGPSGPRKNVRITCGL